MANYTSDAMALDCSPYFERDSTGDCVSAIICNMSTQSSNEGYIPVTGGRVWYKMVGTANAVPLLTLHGGPGSTHDVLEPMAALADERPILFYDQLGSGKSDRPDDVSLWRTERFVEELDQVRRALGLTTIHLYGLSWGSMLAAAYMLTKPAGVQSLILAGPCMSVPRFDKISLARSFRANSPILSNISSDASWIRSTCDGVRRVANALIIFRMNQHHDALAFSTFGSVRRFSRAR
jgi:pimeloyl-ACP methyl ester carboxylesterase